MHVQWNLYQADTLHQVDPKLGPEINILYFF